MLASLHRSSKHLFRSHLLFLLFVHLLNFRSAHSATYLANWAAVISAYQATYCASESTAFISAYQATYCASESTAFMSAYQATYRSTQCAAKWATFRPHLYAANCAAKFSSIK